MQGVRAPQAMASLGVSLADPSRDYAAALVKWEALRAQDGAEVNPVCRSTLLTHGARAEQAAVLVHGVTNCPQQFVQLAPLLFDQGYNVLIPRIPWNGFLDRSGEAMRNRAVHRDRSPAARRQRRDQPAGHAGDALAAQLHDAARPAH